jgi:hypothetical protein
MYMTIFWRTEKHVIFVIAWRTILHSYCARNSQSCHTDQRQDANVVNTSHKCTPLLKPCPLHPESTNTLLLFLLTPKPCSMDAKKVPANNHGMYSCQNCNYTHLTYPLRSLARKTITQLTCASKKSERLQFYPAFNATFAMLSSVSPATSGHHFHLPPTPPLPR